MTKFLHFIFGDPQKRTLSGLRRDVEKISVLESAVAALSDDQLKAKTAEFRERLEKGEDLDALTHEAFATVREAAKRVLGQRHYDVQLMGGLVLHRHAIAEMRTGEGKTLTATLALYLNALEGKGCHLVTVNDYLAKRDSVWMGKVFRALGMTVGCITHDDGFIFDPEFRTPPNPPLEKGGDRAFPPLPEGGQGGEGVSVSVDTTASYKVHADFLRPVSRREAYAADITYGTNNEFGFDYLRDNMASRLQDCVMRDLHYAIVDEVDSILIDEARTPLIISAPAEESNQLYYRFAQIVQYLKEGEDYNLDEKMHAATFTEAGISKVEQALGIDNLYTVANVNLQHFAETALKAKALFAKDVHYVVRGDEIVIVDEFTGRMMEGRRFSEGQHQAIEAKEGVKIQRESLTLATITFQNYFRLYRKIAGMTGTALTEAEEFDKIYGLDVSVIPTNVPIARADHVDKIYKSEKGKFEAVIRDIREHHEKGQPVLVGTTSIEKNELLGSLLVKAGIPHNLLNAKNHMKEGEIIAQAGRPGAVTVATNMAGRGVDIVLGGNPPDSAAQARVRELGGLYVIGTGRHEARRIDNQLRGRSGRQGDPGLSQFYVSMDDDIMRVFGSDRVKGMMNRLGIPEDMPIENKMVMNSIEKAQKRVEGNNFDIRKHLLEYDDVLNKHRKAIYSRRREVLEAYQDDSPPLQGGARGGLRPLKQKILELVEEEIEQVVMFHTGEFVDSPPFKGGARGGSEATESHRKEIGEVIATIIPLSVEQQQTLKTLADACHPTKIVKGAEKNGVAEARTKVIETAMEYVRAHYDAVEGQFENQETLRAIERSVITRAIDTLWMDHLAAMSALRTGIGLQGYGQRDPLVEYKKQSYGMFQHLLGAINQEIVYSFFKYADHALRQQSGQVSPPLQGGARGGQRSIPASLNDKPGLPTVALAKVGRNAPCPCGSGKKYKKCHGA